jgi:hypothetical protein
MDDDIGRQFLQRLKVVTKGLFDEVALFHAGRADVPLEQLAGRAGDYGRDLSFPLQTGTRRSAVPKCDPVAEVHNAAPSIRTKPVVRWFQPCERLLRE